MVMKKMKLPSLFFKRTITSWKWPPFKHLKNIASLPATDRMYKNTNSVLSDTAKFVSVLDSSWSQSKCYVAKTKEEGSEVLLEALKSKRLVFDEPGATSSLLGEDTVFPFQDSKVQTIESNNPYVDFRTSMEDMVKDYGVKGYEEKDTKYLEELLSWYLRMNKKESHGCIIEAFIDMFAGLPSSSCSFSPCSSSKSKDWWEIEIDRFPSYVGKGPKYC
ncbi:transcription repressor OFP13-like [Quillaja saponaria]|uniref:Transcription repressor n=1 Tax=Quillaja saponaria TaxID=32244 RepID=A0AAD7PA92_QUISA|nr:transcription repressor OFP13-like [Quillaja saponaria]